MVKAIGLHLPKRDVAIAPRDTRRSASARGYDRRWREFRAYFLRQHPLCAGSEAGWTGQEPRPGSTHIVAAVDVHHMKKVRDFPELKFNESNCMPQCAPCHRIRTSRGE